MKIFLCIIFFCIFTNAADVNIEKFIIESKQLNKKISSSYGSDLFFKGLDQKGNLTFWVISDRGPNTKAPKIIKKNSLYEAKFFPIPDFTPSIALLVLEKDKAYIKKEINLKQDGVKVSGIPNKTNLNNTELGLDFNFKELNYDKNGLDTEGISVDKNGNFWISDEYGPYIIKVDSKGNILEKYSPNDILPSILNNRKLNNGIEAISINNKEEIIFAMQSVLNINNQNSKYIRIVKFNPKNKLSKMYAYEIGNGYKNSSDAKIGAITFLNEDKFLIIEQGKQNGIMQNLIYIIDLKNASEIPNTEDLEFNNIKKLKTIEKKLLLNLRDYGWDIEKAEGIALINNKTLAIIGDNDFGIKTGIVNNEHKKSKIKNYSYDIDRKELYYKNKKTDAVFFIEPKEKNDNQIWIFTFDSDIK
ncbi:phytase esterase-like protein [Campylobacter sp. RM16704]|uniref:phytase esterase-like protein n=1 Tax=Campylobacter sp. RM16704 TaxID=1500960 RepID=UPI00057D0018|nr:phytase esterase-like protein [Campylobacter sp. RM16704]AJC86863.1 phytase esterase-like protein [Campylobacter sp. RM16704]